MEQSKIIDTLETYQSPLIVRITHLAWKILIADSRHMSDLGIQNKILFEGLEFGTSKFTWNGR